jgi:hypothetical protein
MTDRVLALMVLCIGGARSTPENDERVTRMQPAAWRNSRRQSERRSSAWCLGTISMPTLLWFAYAAMVASTTVMDLADDHDLRLATLSPSLNSTIMATATATTMSCVAYNRVYESSSTIGCSVKPGAGVVCPLGIGFYSWTCRNGQWVQSSSKPTVRRPAR